MDVRGERLEWFWATALRGLNSLGTSELAAAMCHTKVWTPNEAGAFRGLLGANVP